MRPRTLEEFIGQAAIINQIKHAVDSARITSMIFFGPPVDADYDGEFRKYLTVDGDRIGLGAARHGGFGSTNF